MIARRPHAKVLPYTRARQVAQDLSVIQRRHVIHGLIEVDVTRPRARLAAYARERGESLSFTAYVIWCWRERSASRACSRHTASGGGASLAGTFRQQIADADLGQETGGCCIIKGESTGAVGKARSSPWEEATQVAARRTRRGR
jgi:hypothetical protein